jgi:dihydrodipicolinate synthase/N-acetylneuraminate lyase
MSFLGFELSCCAHGLVSMHLQCEQARMNRSFSGGSLRFFGSLFFVGADTVIVVVAILMAPTIVQLSQHQSQNRVINGGV